MLDKNQVSLSVLENTLKEVSIASESQQIAWAIAWIAEGVSEGITEYCWYSTEFPLAYPLACMC